MDGWGDFVVQTTVPMERVEQGRGLEPLALVVHIRFGWVAMPQMWAFALRISLLAKPRSELATVAWVLHKKLWLHTGTSFLHSPEFGFGRKHYQCCLVVVVLQVVLEGVVAIGRPSL